MKMNEVAMKWLKDRMVTVRRLINGASATDNSNGLDSYKSELDALEYADVAVQRRIPIPAIQPSESLSYACPRCGHHFKEKQYFCHYCGQHISYLTPKDDDATIEQQEYECTIKMAYDSTRDKDVVTFTLEHTTLSIDAADLINALDVTLEDGVTACVSVDYDTP
jgi:hypothetical protein